MQQAYWFEKVIQKLEHIFGRFAITRLAFYIVMFNSLAYVLEHIKPGYVEFLSLNLKKVLEGQVWRLFTYIFIPPSLDLIFIIFALYFIYLIGTGLEGYWGTFRFNLYYFLGMLATTIIGLCFPEGNVTNAYINTSLFLAFAAVYPDFMVYIFFIIPIKMKYLAILTWLGIFISIIIGPWIWKLQALVSVLNYVLFFWPDIVQNARLMHRGNKPIQAFSVQENEPFHKCAICNKTERDDKILEFRVCSGCNREFCLHHLKDHKH